MRNMTYSLKYLLEGCPSTKRNMISFYQWKCIVKCKQNNYFYARLERGS